MHRQAQGPIRPPVMRMIVALIGGIALLGLTGAARAADAPSAKDSKVTLRQGYFSGVGLPGIFAAIDQGYFAQEGITLTTTSFSSGPAEIAALIGGSLDVSQADIIGWATAVAGGQALYVITPGSQPDTPAGDYQTQRIVTTRASGITQAADLKGKTIGVGASPLAKVTAILWLEQQHVDAKSVDFQIVANVPSLPNLLSTGQVAAAGLGDPFVEQLDRDVGIHVLGFPIATVPKGSAFTGIISTRDFIAKNPDVVVRYVRAYRRGAAYFNAATQTERARLVKLGDFDLAQLTPKLPNIIEQFQYNKASDGPIDVAATQKWVDTAVRYGGMPKTVEIAPFVYKTAVEAIH
jgi:NitT/TauT family transport system substrate-binding protein